MFNITELLVAFLISFFSTLLLVYPVKKLAFRYNIMDLPNYRKVHKNPTPRLGGLAIFLGGTLGLVYIQPTNDFLLEIGIGATIILVTGILDDKYTIKPIVKLIGQIIPACILIFSGLLIDKITLPIFGQVELGFLSPIITLIWIVGITNAINLIDGLDGLASGVSTIALISVLIMAVTDYKIFVVYLCIVLIGSNLGFLVHNFHPAKIYMGDTGSLLLGFLISVISILGLFKNITFFSFVIPIIVLAIPIFDTLFAIVRRWINGEKIMMPDKKHIHHQLLAAGYSHRTTVLIIYGFSSLFGLLAIIFSNASLNLLVVLTLLLWFLLHLIAEIVGLVGHGKRPILKRIKRLLDTRNHKIRNK